MFFLTALNFWLCPTERTERTEIFFAPCKDFLSFLWDYYIVSFLCPTERTERTEIFSSAQIFILHYAKTFCHFCGTIIIIVSFFVPRKERKKRKYLLCTIRSLCELILFCVCIPFFFAQDLLGFKKML